MFIKEILNGGLVQTRHATLLRPGEVQQCDDCILKPGDPALYSAPGRSLYGTIRSVSVTCTTNGTTALSSSSAFGTDVASVTTANKSPVVTSEDAFGSVQVGQSVAGVGIPAGAIVRRVISTSAVELNLNCTASGPVTVTFSDFHPGTFISGAGITTGTTISSITSASLLTMSLAASDSTTASRTFSESVSGLRYLGFDDANSPALIAKAADKVYISTLSGLTGTWSALFSGLSQDADTTLETVQYANKHIILTGQDLPRLVYYKDNGSGSQTIQGRTAGMKPVTDFVGPTTISGSFPSLTNFQNGWYYFLVTEALNPGADGFDTPDTVEGTYTGTPKAVHITDYQTQGCRVVYTASANTPVNNGLYGANTATHWRVYMAPKQKDQFPVPGVSSFVRVATVPIASNYIDLKEANPHQYGYARSYATTPGFDTLFPYDAAPVLSTVAAQSVGSVTTTINSNIVTHGASGFAAVTIGMVVTGTDIPYGTVVIAAAAGQLTLSNNATGSSGAATLYFGNNNSFNDSFGIVPPNASLYRSGDFGNFGIQNQFGFASGAVTGVEVTIRGQWLADNDRGDDRGFWVSLVKGSPSSPTAVSSERWVHFSQGSYRTGYMKLGGPQETWGIAWVPADFIDGAATFFVRLRKHASAVNQGHYIDGVQVKVYEGSTNLNLDGAPFRTIVISDQVGSAFGTGANGSPPVASTGCILEGMVILNDLNDESSIVASLPDEPEAYPPTYRLPLEGAENDKVRVLRRLGSAAVIGCQNTVKRLNYFPKETDAEFTRGRAYEDIATDHGMVGTRAARLINLPGRGPVLLYLSYNGLHWTDAVTTTPANEDLDWSTLIEPSMIQRTTLEVYPRLYLVAMHYVPYGQTRKTKVMYFSYHSTHLKQGFKLPAIGPVSCESGSSASFLLNGVPYLLTGHGTDGKVYVEDQGTTDASGGTITPAIRTRRFFATEIGRSGRVEQLHLLADASGDSTTGGFSVEVRRQNQGEAVTLIDTKTGDTSVGGVIELWPDHQFETFDFKLTKSAAQSAPLRLHYFGFNALDYGPDVNR